MPWPPDLLPLLLVFLFVLGGCGGADADGAAAGGDGEGGEAARADGQESVDVSGMGFDEGDAGTAVLQVIEFSDFGCGFCRQFHEETYPALHEEFIQSGEVLWKYVPFVIGRFPNGTEAALAAECAGEQGRFPAMRDILFREQGEWTQAGNVELLFAGYGREAGVSADAFATCLSEQRPAGRIERANEAARQLGVRGTPTFFVSGQPVQGAVPLDLFQEVLRAEVAARTP